VYRKAPKFARLALAAAYDRAIAGSDTRWLLDDSRDQTAAELSNRSIWWQFDHNLEHLIPQSDDDALRPHILHGLGNLTLVPKWVNSSLSNKPWERKQRLFELIAESSEIRAQEYLKSLKSANLLESDETSLQRITTEGIYQGVAKAVAALPTVLSDEILTRRGQNILDRAHRRLLRWLPDQS
jgi:hypothetical protein